MGEGLIPGAILLAREVRRGIDHSPQALHAASLGRADIYRHAMLEAGYVLPKGAEEPASICEVCGYDFGAHVSHAETRGQKDGWVVLAWNPTDAERKAVAYCLRDMADAAQAPAPPETTRADGGEG